MIRCVLVVFLVMCAPASAATHHYRTFHTPSKLIRCFQLKYEGHGVECSAPYLPRYGEGDPYLHLEPHGKAMKGARGDYPGYDAKDHVLPYGDTNVKRGVRCTSKSDGLTCRNKDGHGFHIAKGDIRTF